MGWSYIADSKNADMFLPCPQGKSRLKTLQWSAQGKGMIVKTCSAGKSMWYPSDFLKSFVMNQIIPNKASC